MGIGGTELNALRTAERLDRSRFDLSVICLQEDGPLLARYRARGIPVVCLPLGRLYGLTALRQGRRLARHLSSNGIDIDFENVGGEIMHAVLDRMNIFGRVALCGLISGYTKADPSLASFGTVLVKRLRVQGFIIIDYVSRFMEAATQLGQWKMLGKLKDRETIVEGLEKAPHAINMLFTGGNIGKLIVKA